MILIETHETNVSCMDEKNGRIEVTPSDSNDGQNREAARPIPSPPGINTQAVDDAPTPTRAGNPLVWGPWRITFPDGSVIQVVETGERAS